MRAIICGGRDYDDYLQLAAFLDKINAERPITLVIQGEARGADRLAKLWARTRKIPFDGYPADWDTYGNAAGPIRNREMLLEGKPDIVIAFPGGSGTENMVKQARKQGVEVIRFGG